MCNQYIAMNSISCKEIERGMQGRHLIGFAEKISHEYLGTFATCFMEVRYHEWAIVSSKIEFSVSQVQIILVVRNAQRELKQPVN